MDRRDKKRWAVLELTAIGTHKVESGEILPILEKMFPDCEVFVPHAIFQSGARQVSVALMEGYCFVTSGMPEVFYFRSEKSPYIQSVMSVEDDRGIRVLSTVEDDHITSLKERLGEYISSTIEPGMSVRCVDGTFRGLEGEVLQILPDNRASVLITLRSASMIVSVPKTALEKIGDPIPMHNLLPEIVANMLFGFCRGTGVHRYAKIRDLSKKVSELESILTGTI